MDIAAKLTPSGIAKYFLYRASLDGDLVSPLKMQKLVYYAYAWALVKNKRKLFNENIEAWPNGPVLPSLYKELKKYGSAPIPEDFIDAGSEEELTKQFPKDVLETLDKVYEKYMTLTAFELVVLTHSEKPWVEARKGLRSNETSHKPISDDHIKEQYSSATL